MSKIFTTESLSLLRDEFKNYKELDHFLDKYKNETFDFSSLQLVNDPDYPVLKEESVQAFYQSFKDDPKDEFSLAKILYEAIPLDPNQAANNLFWLYLNLDVFFNYIKERWIQKWEEDEEKLLNELEKFFLSLEPSQNSLIKSPIAGLWWAIHLTIDKTLTDQYYYSKIFLSERNLRDKNIGSYMLIRDKKVMQAALEFYNKYKNTELNGKRIGSEAIAQQMIKTLNQIGGLTVLSYLEKEEVYQKMEDYKDTIFQRARKVQLGKKFSRERIEDIRNKHANLFNEEEPIIIEKEKNTSSKNERKSKKEKFLFFFNLRSNGEYNLTSQQVNNFDFHAKINKEDRKKDLLICYNEFGYINRVKISELLKKKRVLYQNGIYGNHTINRILIVNPTDIIGVTYKKNKKKYFKAFYASKLKDKNGTVGLKGYKTMYENYDTIDYLVLPLSLENEISKLIFKSFTASGKPFDNLNYKKEFSKINDNSNNIEFNLF
jgi:hypothetical protein